MGGSRTLGATVACVHGPRHVQSGYNQDCEPCQGVDQMVPWQ